MVSNGLQSLGHFGTFGNVVVTSQGFHLAGVQPGVPEERGVCDAAIVPVFGFAETQAIGDRQVGVVPPVPPAMAERPLKARTTGAAARPA